MLSTRAADYLQTWDRLPHIDDLDAVASALNRALVPVTQELLDYHRTFAGYLHREGAEWFIFGLVHPSSYWITPGEVSAWKEAPDSERWFVTCADTHPSHDLRLDQFGVFYASGSRCASSFFLRFEQIALIDWEFSRNRTVRRVPLWLFNDRDVLLNRWHQRLEGRCNRELSDEYSQIYATGELVVYRWGVYVDAWLAGSKCPEELAGLRLEL